MSQYPTITVWKIGPEYLVLDDWNIGTGGNPLRVSSPPPLSPRVRVYEGAGQHNGTSLAFAPIVNSCRKRLQLQEVTLVQPNVGRDDLEIGNKNLNLNTAYDG